MAWIQTESGARNVREQTANGVKSEVVVGYDVTSDLYRVHIYRTNVDGKKVKVDVTDVNANTLEEGFKLGASIDSDLL